MSAEASAATPKPTAEPEGSRHKEVEQPAPSDESKAENPKAPDVATDKGQEEKPVEKKGDLADKDDDGSGSKGDSKSQSKDGEKDKPKSAKEEDEELMNKPPPSKETLQKYAIHSELKDELDKEIAKKPEAEWGVVHEDTPAQEGPGDDKGGDAAKPGPPPKAKSSDASAADTEGATDATGKEGVGAKLKHMIHHDKK